MPASVKQLAVDTNILMDLADRSDSAHTFREEFQRRQFGLCVPPTVLQELRHLAENATLREQGLAQNALQQMGQWRLIPLQASTAELLRATAFSRLLIRRGWLPAEELSDGRILGETSLAQIPALVTRDEEHMLSIDADGLERAFLDLGMTNVLPLHPNELLRGLR